MTIANYGDCSGVHDVSNMAVKLRKGREHRVTPATTQMSKESKSVFAKLRTHTKAVRLPLSRVLAAIFSYFFQLS